ncbi:Carboxy-S-adenosyl-L-methionine synthase [Candidatus Profftia lariciata]|uniref:carboxy-S-adenosyl-L-methionine synthase CmoA n=1 Tax=Candidatus Profftia lariciata TaxID=1987921 RepID=UPI001D02A058|nr:carboxy-S-adenosyl-L-methionine synthase CmoA [Candidatus Profftia lariciata]UDG81430.1 Carboxy-S-adenosyl-L-methionine synthase [Candidatus Profftia lariciata]
MSNQNNFLKNIFNINKKNTHDNLFSMPILKLEDWTFNEHIAEVFTDMLQRSIPGYSNIIAMIGNLAERFVQPNTKVYDLGCSLGTATISIYQNIHIQGCQIIAVDDSPAMIKHCHSNVNNLCDQTSIKIIEACIQDIDINNASMVVLNFTLQFLAPLEKQYVLNKIYQGLLPNGILVLSEKLNFEDKALNKTLFDMHYFFKRNNGYSELEISQKYSMLKNVMFTDSLKTHKHRLNQAGFKHTEIWFQCLNFGSLLAFK